MIFKFSTLDLVLGLSMLGAIYKLDIRLLRILFHRKVLSFTKLGTFPYI